jgi:hypothetical protein
MECLVNLGLFNVVQLCVLGRHRKYCSVHSLAKVLCCHGCAVRNDVLEYQISTSKYTYPYGKPWCCDLDLWTGALKLVTSESLVLEQPLKECLIVLPWHDGWFTCLDKLELYYVLDDLTYDFYSCTPNDLCWHRPAYSNIWNEVGNSDAPLLASAKVFEKWLVRLVSVAPVPRLLR